jgi:hypothetical protein
MSDDSKLVPSPGLYRAIAGMMGWSDPNVARELNTQQVDSILQRLPEPERHEFWRQHRSELKVFQGRAVAKAQKAEAERKAAEPPPKQWLTKVDPPHLERVRVPKRG